MKIDLCNEKDDDKSVEAAPISIKKDCSVTLIVEGNNVLYGGNNTSIGANWGYAGINIDKGGSLTIKGDTGNTLKVYGGGGRLEEFIMTGGYLKAVKGWGPSNHSPAYDIGSGGNDQEPLINDGNAKISGGTVIGNFSDSFSITIDGGSVSCNTTEAKRSDGTKGYQTRMQTGENYYKIDNLKTSLTSYGTKDIFSDGDGKVYLYLPVADAEGGTTADYKHNEQARHYYGKTTDDGEAWIKMDDVLTFKEPVSEPVVGIPFTLSLNNDSELPDGTELEFSISTPDTSETPKIQIETEGTNTIMPDAEVCLKALDRTEYTVTAKTTSGLDSEMYWNAEGTYSGSANVNGNVNSGDHSNVLIWAVIAILALGVAVTVVIISKRKKK